MILYFDFSAFDDTLPTLEARFQIYCGIRVAQALESHPDLFSAADAQRVLAPEGIDGKLNELFRLAGLRGVPLYVLIDEYDNFANTILAADGGGRLSRFRSRRRLLPQLLCHIEGWHRTRRPARPAVRHRRLADHHGRT